jgi:Domain of unknown function (DU1801)
MQSKAKTVKQYLAELPADRRAAIGAVRDVILKNLDKNYEECMSYGMIGYVVPHSVYPPGYQCNPALPLPFACLASQKNHMAVYLCGLYGDSANARWFQGAWAKTGKKLDMGKACIRFKKLDDLALDVIGESIRRMPAQAYIAYVEERRGMSGNVAARASGAKRKAKPKATEKQAKPAKARSAERG